MEGRSSEALPEPVSLQPASRQAQASHHSVQKGHGVGPQERQGTLSAWSGLSVITRLGYQFVFVRKLVFSLE